MRSLLESSGSDRPFDLLRAVFDQTQKFRAVRVLLTSAAAVFCPEYKGVIVCNGCGRGNSDQVLPFVACIAGFLFQLPLCGGKRVLMAGLIVGRRDVFAAG